MSPITVLLLLSCIPWWVIAYRAVRHGFRVRTMEEGDCRRTDWPRLSVIVCACNEEDTLEAALTSLAMQTYPNLQLVVVDDRSVDQTGQILDETAARFPMIEAVHLHELPEGWVGKVWAQHQGALRAQGRWLLFTDADIHFRPGTLERAVYRAEQRNADHLVVFPRLISSGFILPVLMQTFQLLAFARLSISKESRVAKGSFLGIGAFNMVRRSSYGRCAGFPWLKMEVIDDMGLGLAMAEAGYRTELISGLDWLGVDWYPSFKAMAVGLEKNGYAALASWRPYVAVPKLVAMCGLALGPWLALGLVPRLQLFATLTLVVTALSSWITARRWRQGGWTAPFFALGLMLVVGIMVRAILLAHWRRGVYWRGTFYSLTALRKGQRVFF